MRILILSLDFTPLIGGVADYVYHLSNALAQEGIEVTVLTRKDPRIRADGSVKVMPLLEGSPATWFPIISRTLNEIRPDIVNFHYVPYMYNYYGVPFHIVPLTALIKLTGTKLITTFHEVATRFDLRAPKYLGIALSQRIIAYAICSMSHRCIVSVNRYRRMLQFAKGKIAQIPVGSSVLPVELSLQEKAGLRKEMGGNFDLHITTFGANPRRNVSVLLESIKSLRETYHLRARCHVLGYKSEKWIASINEQAARMGIGDAVRIPGFLNPEAVYKYLAASDVFMIADEFDNRGWGGVSTKSTSVAAAYAAGLPIIGIRGDMTDEFFRHRVNILLTTGISADEFAAAASEVAIDRQLSNALRRGAHETYKEFLQWPVIARKYMAVWSRSNEEGVPRLLPTTGKR